MDEIKKEMNRQEVYRVLDGERDYQNQFVDERGYATNHPIAAELIMMQTYLNTAMTTWTHSSAKNDDGEAQVLDVMRKMVAMGVRCFENWGVPERKAFKPTKH